MRKRRPILIEWTGGRRPPGDEVAPIDLRIDHVFLASCKYLSANIADPSPGRLFDGLLTTSGDWPRGDWYLETAPEELRKLYLECKNAVDLEDLPDDPARLEPADESDCASRDLRGSSRTDSGRPTWTSCNAVSNASAMRWQGPSTGTATPSRCSGGSFESGTPLITCSGPTPRDRFDFG